MGARAQTYECELENGNKKKLGRCIVRAESVNESNLAAKFKIVG